MCLSSVEMCIAFPIDFVVHFCGKRGNVSQRTLIVKSWIAIILHLTAGLTCFIWTYINEKDISFVVAYYDWKVWVMCYACGEILMNLRIIFLYKLKDGGFKAVMRLFEKLNGEQTRSVIVNKILLNCLSLIIIYFSVAIFAVYWDPFRAVKQNENNMENFDKIQWASLLLMFPVVTGFCFYTKIISGAWFVKWMIEIKQIVYEFHYIVIRNFYPEFYAVNENKKSRFGYFMADFGVVSCCMFLSWLLYLIIKPIK